MQSAWDTVHFRNGVPGNDSWVSVALTAPDFSLRMRGGRPSLHSNPTLVITACIRLFSIASPITPIPVFV